MPRFLPPHLDTEKSNVENSENTTLFLVSCFQYIFSGIVQSVGPPFRQTMRNNRTYMNICPTSMANRCTVPFVVTVVASSLFSAYMLFDPGPWLAKMMVLTPMTFDFEVFLFVLALGGLACAWISERNVFPWLARSLGKVHDRLWPSRRKKRKEYKLLLEEMRM